MLTNKERIINTGNQLILEHQSDPTFEVEIEVRFGYVRTKNNLTRTGLTYSQFSRLRNHLDDSYQGVQLSGVDHYIKDRKERKRRRLINSTPDIPTDQTASVQYSIKTGISIDTLEYNYRVSLAKEIKLEPFEIKDPLIRSWIRKSYTINNCRIDLTEVKETNSIVYEAEIELINQSILNEDILGELERLIDELYRVIYDTNIVYSTTEQYVMETEIGQLLTGDPYIKHNYLTQARDLKFRDLTIGGITDNTKDIFTVTRKADGVRKLLIYHRSGIWLYYPTRNKPGASIAQTKANIECNLIHRFTDENFSSYVLDGELIPVNNRKADFGAPVSKYWFLIFDMMIHEDTTIELPHAQRMSLAGHLTTRINQSLSSSLLTVGTKDFLTLGSPDDFFSVMRTMFTNSEISPYENDGFIFTPEYASYNWNFNFNNGKPKFVDLSERTLSKHLDICKWKPIEKLSIDLGITQATNGIDVYIIDPNGNKIPFRGTELNPFDPSSIQESKLLSDLPSGTIGEFKWTSDIKRLELIRIRYDKQLPNSKAIAFDVWDDIHHPITREILEGKTFTFLRRYHNRIKNDLLRKALLDVKRSTNTKILFDIGSGKGGDVKKWQGFTHVYAVEPNEINRAELKRRIELSQVNTPNITIVPYGAEDTPNIIGVLGDIKVDIISCMNSLTFFWKTPDMLNGLARTLDAISKPETKIIFLTMDGNSVTEVFRPAFSTYSVSELNFGPATLKLDNKLLNVDIKETIVSHQEEGLVFVSDLALRGWTLDYLTYADKDKFMSSDESIFTRLYSYGTLKRNLSRKKIVSKMALVLEDKNQTFRTPIDTKLGSIQDDITIRIGHLEQTPIYRVSTISDNASGFYHAFLKAIDHKLYSKTSDINVRKDIVVHFRRDVVEAMRKETDDKRPCWTRLADGILLANTIRKLGLVSKYYYNRTKMDELRLKQHNLRERITPLDMEYSSSLGGGKLTPNEIQTLNDAKIEIANYDRQIAEYRPKINAVVDEADSRRLLSAGEVMNRIANNPSATSNNMNALVTIDIIRVIANIYGINIIILNNAFQIDNVIEGGPVEGQQRPWIVLLKPFGTSYDAMQPLAIQENGVYRTAFPNNSPFIRGLYQLKTTAVLSAEEAKTDYKTRFLDQALKSFIVDQKIIDEKTSRSVFSVPLAQIGSKTYYVMFRFIDSTQYPPIQPIGTPSVLADALSYKNELDQLAAQRGDLIMSDVTKYM